MHNFFVLAKTNISLQKLRNTSRNTDYCLIGDNVFSFSFFFVMKQKFLCMLMEKQKKVRKQVKNCNAFILFLFLASKMQKAEIFCSTT